MNDPALCPVCMMRGPCEHKNRNDETSAGLAASTDAGHNTPTVSEDDETAASPDTEEEDEPDTAVLVPLSNVKPERLEWLWEGRLPRGKLVTIDGDPSVGKSTLAVDIAAHISMGKPWPDGAPCEQGDVLILSAEDGLADTIRPRTDAAGGQPARIHALTAVRTTNDKGEAVDRPPTLADITAIRAAILRTGAVLVVIDVLMAYLPGRVDSHKDQDIRAVLSRLTKLGEETGCTFLLLRHLNKAGGGSPLYRGGGSIGIVGAARAGFLVARDPDDPDTRVLACVKSNLAREPESLSYRLESVPDSHVAHIVWTGASAHDAAALLRVANDSDDDERTDRDEAAEWLISFLIDKKGTAPASDVMKAARADGIAERTLKRARQRAGITSQRSGFPARAVWSYDPVGPQSGQSGQGSEAGTTGPTGGPTGGGT